jgi:hypothetical protein
MPRPVTFITVFSMAVLLMSFAGCASAGNHQTAPAVMTGTVNYLDIEGGCWIIRTDEGKTLYPLNLPRSVRRNGLRVSFTSTPATGTVTSCMAGEPVRLLSIEPLPPAQNPR